MHVSIKVVVGALIALTCLGAAACAIVPTVASLQDDVRAFVLQASISAADQVQFVLAERLHRVRNLGNAVYMAATTNDLLSHLQPWNLVKWSGLATVDNDISLVLSRLDDRGVLLAPYNTMIAVGGVPIPGYVRVTNYTLPGSYVDSGYFSYNTLLPLNSTYPWSRSTLTVKFSNQKYYPQLINPNRSTPMMWLSLSPRIGAQQLVASVILFGGPVSVPQATDPLNRKQLLSLRVRGEAISQYLNSVRVSETGVAVLADAATSTFVAGSITDPTGKFVNNTAQLLKMSELRDPRIAKILRASYAGASGGLSALMSCTPPCSFTFWPHRGALAATDDDHVGIVDVLVYDFTSVRVVQISEAAGGLLDMRLIVTVPSSDIIGALVSSLRSSIVRPVIAMVAFCIVLVAGVALVFRRLSVVEEEVLQMARVFQVQPLASRDGETDTSRDASTGSSPSKKTRKLIMDFKEISGLLAAVQSLSRELHTLRAFTAIGDRAAFADVTTIGSSEVSSQPMSHPHSQHLSDTGGIPYQFIDGQLWRVPVTTIYGALARDLLDPKEDPIFVHRLHSTVLTALQQHVSKFSGASVDHLFGDHFLVHFNASSRTPKHVLAGVSVAIGVLAEVKRLSLLHNIGTVGKKPHIKSEVGEVASSLPLTPSATTPMSTIKVAAPQKTPRRPLLCLGVASCLSHCGLMGPSRLMQVFTVVSVGESQAAALSRIAMTIDVPTLVTWRVADMVRHEGGSKKTSLDSRFHSATTCKFRNASKVILPGDSSTVSTNAYSIDAAPNA